MEIIRRNTIPAACLKNNLGSWKLKMLNRLMLSLQNLWE
jgi:hypothetical protein